MSKRSKHGGLPGKGGGMMQQIQKLQQEMVKAQEELADTEVEGSAGGGAVKVTVTGDQQLWGIKIDPALVDDGDVEMLEDLVLAAINNGLEKSREVAAERLGPLADGGLPF